tara:strand:- start:692 stop:1159 length:468 start_codon:yes stop_codon:yes gene_type:complete
MAQQSKKTSAGSMKATVTTNGEEKVEFEPVKAIEEETLASIKGQKTFIYIILGLLAYLIFMVIPGIDEKVRWVEKDLNSVLIQSERYELGTRVFAKGNACAECHLDPDYLISGLHAKYPSFSDLKGFMKVGHQRYYTMAQEMPDAELMEIYRTLK